MGSQGCPVELVLGRTKAGPGTAARKDLKCGPHGRGQKGDLVVGIVRGHHLGCVLEAEQEREEAGRGDPKIRGRKQMTLPPWVIAEPHPGARQG